MKASEIIKMTINGLKISDPRLAQCLKKWQPYLVSRIDRVSNVTNKDHEDVTQEMLSGIIKRYRMFDVPLYRYEGSLYELMAEDKDILILKTPRYNKIKNQPLAVPRKAVEIVKKSKLESTVYREITQQCVDIINLHFSAKNGFKKVKAEKVVTVRSDRDQVKTKVKKIDVVVDSVEVVDESHAVNIPDFYKSTEEVVECREAISCLKNRLSGVSSRVLNFMLDYPEASNDRMSNELYFPKHVVQYAKSEILRNFREMNLDMNMEMTHDVRPVYISAAEAF